MKFTWFNLCPWPHSLENFRTEHRSVRVDLPSDPFDPEEGNYVYNSYLDHWRKRVGGAKRVEIAGAGHMLTSEGPEEVAAALLGFLDSSKTERM